MAAGLKSSDVIAATCTISINGKAAGSGVFIGNGRVLCAGHTIGTNESVQVAFVNTAHKQERTATVLANQKTLGVDAAVLQIVEGERGGVPAPVALAPWRRLPATVRVYGFPQQDADQWVERDVVGSVGDAEVQVTGNDGGPRTKAGQSGGPAIDAEGDLVGLLVAGQDNVPTDRLIPVVEIADRCDLIALPWAFAGDNCHAHFEKRAGGYRFDGRPGDLFSGRKQALQAIEAFLRDPPVQRVLVLTADPGSGKSACVARAVKQVAGGSSPLDGGLAFHARQATGDDLVRAVANAAGVEASTRAELIPALQAQAQHQTQTQSQHGTRLVIDALDEAASGRARSELVELATDLARMNWRVVVATRSLGSLAEEVTNHLRSLGVGSLDANHLIDLDSTTYFDREDLVAYAGASLAQSGLENQGPDGAAWEAYRDDGALCQRMAELIAARAGKSYLVAAIAAAEISENDRPVDPAEPGFDEASVPSSVDEALSKYLDGLEPAWREKAVRLLTALAYGRGDGLSNQRWLHFAEVLWPGTITAADRDRLVASRAADLLLESPTIDGRTVTRLFHQALADQLLTAPGRRLVDDERQLAEAMLAEAEQDWAAITPYIRDQLPFHAAAAGVLDEYLANAGVLAACHPASIRSALSSRGVRTEAAAADDPAVVFEAALPQLGEDAGARASYLSLLAGAQGATDLAAKLDALAIDRPWHLSGSLLPFSPALASFTGHTDAVLSVVAVDWPGLDHQVVVTTSFDGTARVWDPLRPEVTLGSFTGHTGAVLSVAAVDWPGLDHQVVVTTSFDGTARVWDPLRPEVTLGSFTGHTGAVLSVVAVDWPGLDHQVVVTTSFDGTARVWDPLRAEVTLGSFTGHTGEVLSVAAVDWPGLDHQAVVTTSVDGTARVWDPLRAEVTLGSFTGHTDAVVSVAAVDWPGLDHQAVVTTSDDGTARVWDPLRAEVTLGSFTGHTGAVVSVAAVDWPGLDHQAVVTTSFDGTAKIWDPLGPEVTLGSFTGHTGEVLSVAAVDWPGLDHQAVVTTSVDGTARVWDPLGPEVTLGSFTGHTGAVVSVAAVDWPGLDHQAVVTTSFDGTARVWDPLGPEVTLGSFTGHTGAVVSVAAVDWPGLDHQAVVTTSVDGTARVWDPLRPEVTLGSFTGHTDTVVSVAAVDWPGLDHQAVVTTSFDGTARVWDPLRPEVTLGSFTGHTDTVVSVAAVDWPGLDHQAVVTTSFDGTARVWDPQDPERVLASVPVGGSCWLGIALIDERSFVVPTNRGWVLVRFPVSR